MIISSIPLIYTYRTRETLAAGIITDSFISTAYGTTQLSEGNSQKRFALHRIDSDDLVYMNARYYSPYVSSFVSKDPSSTFAPESFLADPLQMNLYGYGRGNPVGWNDPTGQAILKGKTAEKANQGLDYVKKKTIETLKFAKAMGQFALGVSGPAVAEFYIAKAFTSISTAGEAVMGAKTLSKGTSVLKGQAVIPNAFTASLDDIVKSATVTLPEGRTVVKGVNVNSINRRTGLTNVYYQGDRDITQALNQLENGTLTARRGGNINLPGVYTNRTNTFPYNSNPSYYHEYYVATPEASIGTTGPERIITGEGGEIWYTPDHYRTNIRVD